MRRAWAHLAWIFFGAACGSSTAARKLSVTPASIDLEERAQRLAAETLIVDGHIDLPYRLLRGHEETGSYEDVAKRSEGGDFDYVRARQGGLDAPFMSIYVPARYQQEGGAYDLANRLIDLIEGLASEHPDKFSTAHAPPGSRGQLQGRTH